MLRVRAEGVACLGADDSVDSQPVASLEGSDRVHGEGPADSVDGPWVELACLQGDLDRRNRRSLRRLGACDYPEQASCENERGHSRWLQHPHFGQ